MKKIIIGGVGSMILSAIVILQPAFADSTGTTDTGATITSTIEIVNDKLVVKKKITVAPRPLLLQNFLYDVCTRMGEGLPALYQQIPVYRPGVAKGTNMYQALQKCVYLGVLEQKTKVTDLTKPVNGEFVTNFLREKIHLTLPDNLLLNDNQDIVEQKFWNDNVRYRVPTYYATKRLLELAARGSNSSFESTLIRSPYFNAVATTYAELKNYYHYLSGSVDEESMMYGAVNGMLQSLNDPYSVYFPPEDSADFLNNIQMNIYGIGVYVDIKDGYFTIISNIKGSPAEIGGILPGDRVLQVDDWVIPASFTLNQVTNRIKGAENTTVKLLIDRAGVQKSYTITRKKISIPLLETTVKNNNVIFTVSSFGKGLDIDFDKAIAEYSQDIKKAKHIIVDLRSNGGGYTDVVLNMLQNFIPKGKILLQAETSEGVTIFTSQAQTAPAFAGKDIIVLVNKGTASASEIMAGAIKEYYPTAKIVGETTYGKGSMQAIVGMPNTGSIKYTVGLWFIGESKTSIEHIGIKPDVELKDDPNTPADEVLDAVVNY